MHNPNGKISIMIICLLVGIMLSVQFRTSESYGPSLRDARSDELLLKNSALSEQNEDLAQEVIALREKVTNMESGNELISELQAELKKSNMAAGLIPVIGPGIIITLNDSPRALQPGQNPNDLLVHDEDILKIVNEMKASGAEAIAVNDQRITAMTEIRCAGTTILVNMNKVAPPFIIKATGDPQLLESGLNIRGGYLEVLKSIGLQTQLEKNDKIEIPAYNGAANFKFTAPKQ
ncbi:MAG: DUF881 domain-containing protein [Syntrophomonadaceae bacterium]|nr:DUF881 domain-containing protein [Syntrophomonadaceae bacterium]